MLTGGDEAAPQEEVVAVAPTQDMSGLTADAAQQDTTQKENETVQEDSPASDNQINE
jgi:hypothetical protein